MSLAYDSSPQTNIMKHNPLYLVTYLLTKIRKSALKKKKYTLYPSPLIHIRQTMETNIEFQVGYYWWWWRWYQPHLYFNHIFAPTTIRIKNIYVYFISIPEQQKNETVLRHDSTRSSYVFEQVIQFSSHARKTFHILFTSCRHMRSRMKGFLVVVWFDMANGKHYKLQITNRRKKTNPLKNSLINLDFFNIVGFLFFFHFVSFSSL